MGILGALGFKAKKEAQELGDNLLMWLRKADPDTMDEYQLNEYDSVLDKLSLDMAQAENTWKKEQAEYENARNKYNSLVDDINLTQGKIVATTTTIELKGKLETHFDNLMVELEALKPEVQREKEEAEDAFAEFNEIKIAVEDSAKRSANARKILDSRKRELGKLEREEERIKRQEDHQKVMQGIKKQADTFGTIVTSYDKEIEQKKLKIQAAKNRVAARELATGPESPAIDPEVAAALGKGTEDAKPKVSRADYSQTLEKI